MHFLKKVENAEILPTLIREEIQLFKHFFSNGCHSERNQDFVMKPKPNEAQNTKFLWEERGHMFRAYKTNVYSVKAAI